MSEETREPSLRAKVVMGLTAVAILGGVVAGGVFGVQKLQEDSAYRRAHVSAVAMMSEEMSKEVMSARSSFVLGVADGTMLPYDIARYHKRYVTDSAINAEYRAAGTAWQKEAGLSRDEIVQLSEHVIGENRALEELYEAARDQVGFATGKEYRAGNLVGVAVLRGMIDAAGGAVELDDRLDRRIDKLLESEGPEAAAILKQVAQDAAAHIAPEARANGKLLTHIQNRLNQMPAELASFTMRVGKFRTNTISFGLGEDAAPSRVPVEPVNEIPLDPFVTGMEVELASPADPFAPLVGKLAEGPSGP